jgi:hypothetical protein
MISWAKKERKELGMRNPVRFHEPQDSDDPLLRLLRQDYLITVSQETRQIPETLRAVMSGDRNFEEWAKSVHFRDDWLISAARATIERWQVHGYDGVVHMRTRAIDASEYGVPGKLSIHLDYQWMAHMGHSWAQFRQLILNEVESALESYRRESMHTWGKQWKPPTYADLRIVAQYQANEIKNPDESLYKRIARAAQRLGLTLRPKNKRTKQT